MILSGFVREFVTCEAVVWMSVHCAANVTFVRKNGPDAVNVSYGHNSGFRLGGVHDVGEDVLVYICLQSFQRYLLLQKIRIRQNVVLSRLVGVEYLYIKNKRSQQVYTYQIHTS